MRHYFITPPEHGGNLFGTSLGNDQKGGATIRENTVTDFKIFKFGSKTKKPKFIIHPFLSPLKLKVVTKEFLDHNSKNACDI
jgi:hypothetical protein